MQKSQSNSTDQWSHQVSRSFCRKAESFESGLVNEGGTKLRLPMVSSLTVQTVNMALINAWESNGYLLFHPFKRTIPPQAMKCEAWLLNFMASSGEFTSRIK